MEAEEDESLAFYTGGGMMGRKRVMSSFSRGEFSFNVALSMRSSSSVRRGVISDSILAVLVVLNCSF